VQLRETRGNIQVLDDPSPTAIYDGPLAVLVDRYSASASEIFAAAIQDYKRGVIIGQQTFGKGSVQNLFNLDRVMRGDNNGQLTLTIGKYYRVTGESTQNRGVIPDIVLPSSVDLETVGENTRDTALPWDRIQATRFQAKPSLDTSIAALQTEQNTHSAGDPDFNYLLNRIAAFEEIRKQDSVSLNLIQRQSELDRQENERFERENARRAALGLEPFATIEDLAEAEPDLILLNQATRMVAEMAAIGGNGGRRQLISGSEAAAAAR
jgi:carboxyl-terminal processing protease